jgi:hypothetical protein
MFTIIKVKEENLDLVKQNIFISKKIWKTSNNFYKTQ